MLKKTHFGSGFRFLAGPGFNEYRMDPKHCFTFAETTNQFSCERCNYRSTFCGLCLQSSSIFSLCVFSLTKPRFNEIVFMFFVWQPWLFYNINDHFRSTFFCWTMSLDAEFQAAVDSIRLVWEFFFLSTLLCVESMWTHDPTIGLHRK